jgi:hypothetical protein
MYIELMKKNQNAHALDSGLTMIAAGLSPYQESRTALINAASKAEQGRMNLSAADLINLQKQQTDMKQRALRQTLLPALAREHQLSPETIAALESSGKLDEVLQSFVTKGLTHIKNDATGETTFFDRHGNKVASAGGGLKPTDDQRELEAYNAKLPPEQRLDMAQWLSTVKREAPAGADRALFENINAEKKAKGEEPITWEFYLKNYKHRQPTNLYIGPEGTPHPAPQPGYDYKRGPDGKIQYGPDGLPIQLPVSEKAKADLARSTAQTTQTTALTGKTEAETAKLLKDEEDRLKKEHRERVASAFTASNVGNAVDSALKNAPQFGASGFFAPLVHNLPFGGTAAVDIRADIATIDANSAVKALTDMRNASQTGAGLGSVSNFEERMLSSTVANLNPYQKTETLINKLIRVKAAMLVMAENKYENDGDAPRFNKDLQAKIGELTAGQISTRSGGKNKVQRIP